MPYKYEVVCPKCRRVQGYIPRGGNVVGKSKTCIVCGHTFRVHKNIKDTRIRRIIKEARRI